MQTARYIWLGVSLSVLTGLLAEPSASRISAAEPEWTTWQANAQRTGCRDGKAGPKSPKVLWTFTARGEQFVASAVPVGDRVFVASIGPLGPGIVRALSAADGKPIWTLPDNNKIGWESGTLKMLGIVSAPAAVGRLTVFGEGLHQHERTTLRAADRTDGRPLWALTVDSRIEGGPSFVDGRVFVGVGRQGVVALDPTKTVFSSKAVKAIADLKVSPAYAALLDKELPAEQAREHWEKEFARLADEAKKDCLPPAELPRPAPRELWRVGAGKLDVTAAVAVADGRVFVPSAYVDFDKLGHRAVLALSAADGKVLWERPTTYNPYGSPSVVGDTVIVGCTSVRMEPTGLSDAKGEVIAFAAADGAVRWKKSMPGGVLSSTAVVGGIGEAGVGFVSCTDGRVYALDVKTGETRWSYDAKAPFFATPAVADGVVYVSDLKGTLHAVDATKGTPIWTLKLADHGLGGLVYASATLAEGRLYLSVAGDAGGVICIGQK